MTTTEEVPMPEPAIQCALFAEGQRVIVSGEYSGPWPPSDRGPMSYAYTADQVRDTAIKYADARCAKLQAAHDAKYAELLAEAIEWRDMDAATRAERDALAEKVKAMEDNDRRYRWLRDPPNMPAVAWIEGRGNRYIDSEWLTGEHADAAIDAASGEQP